MGFFGVLKAIRHLIDEKPKRCTDQAVAVATAVDLLALLITRAEGVTTIATGLSVLAVISLSHLPYMPRWVGLRFVKLSVGVVVLMILFFNEMLNCVKMIEFAALPYHVIIELWGMFLFLYMGSTFIEWDAFNRQRV